MSTANSLLAQGHGDGVAKLQGLIADQLTMRHSFWPCQERPGIKHHSTQLTCFGEDYRV